MVNYLLGILAALALMFGAVTVEPEVKGGVDTCPIFQFDHDHDTDHQHR